MTEEKEWRFAKIKFDNLELNIRTDGETLRIRKAGTLPVSCTMAKPTDGHVPVLKIKEDVNFVRPEE